MKITDIDDRDDCLKWAMKSQSRNQIAAMIELAQHQPGIALTPDALDADPMVLGVRNGVVDLNTGKFREGRRGDYITKQAAVAFDPDARCPNWIAFQEKISSNDADLIAYKQRVYGLMLTGLMVEILFIMHGGGNNGKTTEQETIFELLGDYAHAADAALLISPHDQTGPTPEIVALKGKRMLSINEFREGDQLNDQRVKYLCSTDMKSGRGLYQDIINFKPTYKAALKTNPKPRISGTDLGIWRRIHFIPYYVTISPDEEETDFREKKLSPELSGILNWMIAGLRDYLSHGSKLNPPKIVCAATAEYRREMDVIGQWVSIFVERILDNPERAKLSLSTLYSSYERWSADEIGWTATKRKFADYLRNQGFESGHSMGVTSFKGIGFKSEAAPERAAQPDEDAQEEMEI
jgi:putative DNA primase/helicase